MSPGESKVKTEICAPSSFCGDWGHEKRRALSCLCAMIAHARRLGALPRMCVFVPMWDGPRLPVGRTVHAERL